MNERPSLLDEAGIQASDVGGKPSGGGGGMDNQKLKLGVAVALVVAAAGVLGWQFGLFGGGGKKVDPAAAEARRAQFEQDLEQDKAIEAVSRTPAIDAGG